MKSRFSKYIAFVMALILALSSLALLPIGAESEEKYFAFDLLTDENGTEYAPTGAQLSIPVSANGVFTASGLSLRSEESNALYIALINRSTATQICVQYKMQNSEEWQKLTVDLATTATKQTLTVPAPLIGEEIAELQILFPADEATSGTIEFSAFFDVSTYVNDTENEATFTRCHYNAQTKELAVQGSLSYAATVRYEGETLALFSLSEGEDLHLSGKTPIAKTDISFHFSFSVAISRNDELFRRYVVAAITSTGERVPLCTPTYPSLSYATVAPEQGFKGYHSQELFAVVDNVPDVGLVDVYLDRLFGTQSEGILYAGEYDYYYFDQNYVAELERRVNNLVGMGTSVYLRILIGNSRDNLSFADDAPTDATNRLAVLRNEAAQRDLYATIDFLTARLYKQGNISGLILGRAADLISQYSYCDAVDLAQYSAFYAASLNLISGVARHNIPSLRVFVPISDAVWSQSMDSLNSKDFFAELFVPSLLTALEAQILEPQEFGIMLESAALSDRVAEEADTTHLGIDRLPAFLADLEQTAAAHKYLQTSVFFCWQPDTSLDAARLHAEYLLKYATLSQNKRITTFLVDFTLAEEKGNASTAHTIDHLAKYVNTDRCADAAQLALSTLELQTLEQLYAQARDWIARSVYRADLTLDGYTSASAVKGSFAFWSFSSADNTLGWYEGVGCESFFISSVYQEDHALVAQFAPGNGYGEIAYHFDSAVDLSFAPLFVIPISVSGKQAVRYEIQLRLIGDDAVTYASAVIGNGVNEKLYLDLSEVSEALSQVRAIRLMVRPLDGENEEIELHFGGMTIQSATFDNEELAERVNAIRKNKTQTDDQAPMRDYTTPILISAIVVAVSVIISALLVFNHKRKKKT